MFEFGFKYIYFWKQKNSSFIQEMKRSNKVVSDKCTTVKLFIIFIVNKKDLLLNLFTCLHLFQ